MKAKKLFPDSSIKQIWNKIKELEDKIKTDNLIPDSGIDSNTPTYKEQSGTVQDFYTSPGDGADDMLIEFPEVFDTIPTEFYCVESNQSNSFTFTVKELTRSYCIVTVKSTLSWNSVNNFTWKAVAYSENNTNSTSAWSQLGSVVGNSSWIPLPESYNEFLILIMDSTNVYRASAVVANKMFPLDTTESNFILGERGTSSYTSLIGRVIVNKNGFKLKDAYYGASTVSDCSSSCILTVFYR